MKTLVTSVILFFLCLNCFAQDLNRLDRKNGFKGFILGDSISKYKPIIKFNKRFAMFEVTGKPIKVDGFLIRSVFLSFENDKLSEIMISVYGDDAVKHIHQAMKNAYGEGDEKVNEEYLRFVEWDSKRVNATLRENVVAGNLSATIFFKKTSDYLMPKSIENFDSDL
ncbi:MAG: hypothetical protein ACXVAY_20700 [Mucilaginibacter sp.]